jgi:hypothetical protein
LPPSPPAGLVCRVATIFETFSFPPKRKKNYQSWKGREKCESHTRKSKNQALKIAFERNEMICLETKT